MDIPRLVNRRRNLGKFRDTPIDQKSISYCPINETITISGIKNGQGFTYTDKNGVEDIILFKYIEEDFDQNKPEQYIGKKLFIQKTIKLIKGNSKECIRISASFQDPLQQKLNNVNER